MDHGRCSSFEARKSAHLRMTEDLGRLLGGFDEVEDRIEPRDRDADVRKMLPPFDADRQPWSLAAHRPHN
jgi:hypothetical protein